MAQIDYNLTDNVKDSFTFSLGELKYSFRYPTTAELRELGKLNQELQDLAEEQEADGKKSEQDKSGKDYKTLVETKSKESEDAMNKLVTPVEHEHEIGTVLEDQPINVVRNFRNMMNREISLG